MEQSAVMGYYASVIYIVIYIYRLYTKITTPQQMFMAESGMKNRV